MRTKKEYLLFTVAIFVIFVLLSSGVNSVFASAVVSKSSLPDFLESYLEWQAARANMTSSQIDQARALWIERLAINQQVVSSAVSDGVSPLIAYGSHMSTFLYDEKYGGATINYEYNVVGLSDGYFAEFYTPNANGCGATVVGQMSSSNSNGFVYVLAKKGPNALGNLGNYFIAEVSNDPDRYSQQWIAGFVGYVKITIGYNTPGAYYLIGSAPFTFRYLAIASVVMPPPNDQDPYNDVMADSVGSQYG